MPAQQPCPAFYVVVGDLNLDSHAHPAVFLPLSNLPSLRLLLLFIYLFNFLETRSLNLELTNWGYPSWPASSQDPLVSSLQPWGTDILLNGCWGPKLSSSTCILPGCGVGGTPHNVATESPRPHQREMCCCLLSNRREEPWLTSRQDSSALLDLSGQWSRD